MQATATATATADLAPALTAPANAALTLAPESAVTWATKTGKVKAMSSQSASAWAPPSVRKASADDALRRALQSGRFAPFVLDAVQSGLYPVALITKAAQAADSPFVAPECRALIAPLLDAQRGAMPSVSKPMWALFVQSLLNHGTTPGKSGKAPAESYKGQKAQLWALLLEYTAST